MTNHLFQSTLFAALAALLALAFRKNAACTRHGLWLAASIKFLIPFSLLVGLGSQVQWRRAAPPALSYAMESVSRPIATLDVRVTPVSAAPGNWPIIAGATWLSGCAIVLAAWGLRWRRIRSAVRASSPLDLNKGIVTLSTPALLEPGVFGIFRPTLLLPEGIQKRLTPEQLDAIIAHELCHVRRRDNLAAAIHMVVEALFWFHPLVWWIGARLVEERERACDEEVLQMGKEPEVYAESILKVCRLYLESPLVCVSGVTGSDLKKRIEGIMSHGGAHELDFRKKALLAAAGFAGIAAPLMVGVWNAPPVRAQSPSEQRPSFEVASVKPSKGEGGIAMEFASSGRFTARGIPFLFLVATAYGVPFQGPRLSGLDRETASATYDVEATAESGAVPPGASKLVREAKMKLMLQSLLEDRFKMKVRRETRIAPVYAVIVGKNGPKLTKAKFEEKDCPEGDIAKGGICHNFQGGMGRGLHAQAITMTDLTMAVSNWADRPVVDRTAIEGLFEINTEGWTPMAPRPGGQEGAGDAGIDDPARPTLYMIFDRLGLKMESSKAPIEFIIVEHIEKPTAN